MGYSASNSSAASSGTGDVGLDASGNKYGGLDYKTGMSPWLMIAAGGVALMFLMKGFK